MPNKTKTLKSALSQNLPEKAFTFSNSDIEKLKSFSTVALAIIATLGIVSVALLAPNILKLAKHIPKLRKALQSKNKPKETMVKTFYYLKRHNYVSISKSGNEYKVEITEKGKKKLLNLSLNNLKIPHNKKWDNGWWIVLADIPNDFRHQADILRQKIKDMGFYMLQRTVWVYPFDPRNEMAFITKYYGIEKFITIIKTALIDSQDEAVLKHHFNIKNKA